MSKYKFIVDTDVQFFNSTNGKHEIKKFFKNEIIEGATNNPFAAAQKSYPPPPPSTVYTTLDGKMPVFGMFGGNIILSIPLEKLEIISPLNVKPPLTSPGTIVSTAIPQNIFTQKNIIIGSTIISLLLLFGILKYKKII